MEIITGLNIFNFEENASYWNKNRLRMGKIIYYFTNVQYFCFCSLKKNVVLKFWNCFSQCTLASLLTLNTKLSFRS